MTPYAEMIQAIIQKFIVVIGSDRALDVGQSIKGLYINNDGTIRKITSETTSTLLELIEGYRKLLGPAAISFAKDAVRPIVERHPELYVLAILK